MLVLWDEAWNTGYVEIDEQHRHLVKIFNDLDKAILTEKASRLVKSRDKALQELMAYADYHFETEEHLMKIHTYPDAPAHWRIHKDFKSRLYQTVRSHEAGEPILTSQLLSLMLDWLDNHIKVEDRKLGDFLKEHC